MVLKSIEICTSLTRKTDSNSLVVVEWKFKAECRSHVLFEPSFVGSFLRFQSSLAIGIVI